MKETYQAHIHRERVEGRNSYTRELEQARGSILVGYKNGVVGVTVQDKSLRRVQVNLTKDQISQLMKDLADAYKQLEALEAGVPESSVRTVR